MRIEATINGQLLNLEVPSGGGVDKGGVARFGEPNEVITNVAAAVRTVAGELGQALAVETPTSPVAMDVQFGIRIDEKALVSVAMTPGDAQFLVTLRYEC